MTRSQILFSTLAALTLTVTGTSAALFAKNSDPARTDASLTLFGGEAMQGGPVTVRKDIANFQDVPASDGFDGTANDYAYSLRAVGRWEVCMDAGFRTNCQIVDGEVASLGEYGGSISSARYLGPSTRPVVAAADTATQTAPASQASSGTSTASAAPWQPMYRVDLYGSDYRAITYSRPGNTWQTCKASCDADRKCKAWTYVEPGRTPYGECFLKSPVPQASVSECCISGVKGADSSGGRQGAAAIDLGLNRVANTAKRAAEDEVDRAVDRKVRGAVGRILGN
ncbi:MAG TPA: PAN domain-containing protein [Novosphingobium sp.]|nr:PAN domain-containing protein [Novosphingobium sp.]HQA17772.1 PAN domain-containing protein [Novosphingobium sp.]